MKKYYIERIRNTEVEWIVDVADLGFIEAENLKEAKQIVNELYGGFRYFRRARRVHHPEIAGTIGI